MKLRCRFILSLLCTFACSPFAWASAEATIAQARAHVGDDQALDGLRSVRYVGTLVATEETAEGPKPLKVEIDIIFQKPYRQRIVTTAPRSVEITGLDDYEAWQRVQDREQAGAWRLALLPKEQVKNLRANAWENFAYFRGIESRGGRLEDLGEVSLNGRPCHKLGFIHDAEIAFYRYFDRATGKLVLTETAQGGSIQEEGEMVVSGIRFPKKLIQLNKLPDGKERRVEITFDKITVNETFPDSAFAVPAVTPN